MTELATIARPYTKALYNLALEQGKLSSWADGLALLAAVTSDPKVEVLLESPKSDSKEKGEAIIKLVGSDSLDPELNSFVKVLADNQRLELLNVVYVQFKELILAIEHTEEATIYSAYPLDDNQLKELIQKIEEHCKVKLVAKLVVEPELIGGFKVEFGDQVLDMSVKSELASLYRTIIN